MKKAFLFTLLLLPSVTFAQSFPSFPMSFWGTATIDGVSAPFGSIIRVYSAADKLGEVTIKSDGAYGYTEPTEQKLLVSETDGELVFTIQASGINGGIETQGITPITYTEFVSGETVNKDLAFKIANTQTSSGGGGGGGSKKKKTTVTEQPVVLGSATTTVSEMEQKIVLQKQIIALLTQLIQLLQLKYAQ